MECREAERMSRSSTQDSEMLSATQELQGALKDEGSYLTSETRDPEPDKTSVDLQMGLDYLQMLKAPLDPSHGLHGVLRYRRELQEGMISFQAQTSADQSVLCEFCGTPANPPLDPVHGKKPKDFCCLRYREVFEEVVQERRLVLELCEERPSTALGAQHNRITEGEELDLGTGEWANEERRRLQQKEMERFYKDAQARLSVENSLFRNNVIRFQLSGCAPADKTLAEREDSGSEEGPQLLEWHNPSGFGLNHHQGNTSVIRKFYSNGNKFLTGFPDGSAQVFYPSGNLAIVLATDEKERVCVVHDDLTPHSPIRALFQSSGRATCYHSNGEVWLNMCMWGGQSVAKGGARTRRWSWSDHNQAPLPFRPIFLPLNKHVGVRVLGQKSVSLTFLALGQQARFSVGSLIKSNDDASLPHGPPLCKEELMVQASQLYLRLTLTRLRWCLCFPSSSRHRNIKPDAVVLSLARRLLGASHSVSMADMERTFIQHCLQCCNDL